MSTVKYATRKLSEQIPRYYYNTITKVRVCSSSQPLGQDKGVGQECKLKKANKSIRQKKPNLKDKVYKYNL
ncbi:hypothetical protein CAL7716_103660 (plasmid) [Calothrix sp. PCC 7716]|nr:hypothetical protein CAL7716_103660 [Calothrix sp. PCC 7716]